MIWKFWVCPLSPAWYNIDCSQLMTWFDHYQLLLVYLTMEYHLVRNLQCKTSQTTLAHSISHSTFSIRCTNLFLCLSSIYTFLEIIKHDLLKCHFLPFSILECLPQNSPILMFVLMHADMNTVTIQSNKIVCNEVKGS